MYGFHSVEALLSSSPETIKMVYIDSERKDRRLQQLVASANQHSLKIEAACGDKLDKITGMAKHQGVVAILESLQSVTQLTLKELIGAAESKENSIILVLDGITDPHNLGAIIRTCDCFGVDAVIIPKDNSASINATVAKTSAGAVNYLPVIVVNNLARTLEELKEAGYWIAGTTLADNSVDMFCFTPDKKMVWVMGSEDKGIRRLVAENCDYLVSIPMFGQTQSLNVSVAAGVVLSYTRYSTKKT